MQRAKIYNYFFEKKNHEMNTHSALDNRPPTDNINNKYSDDSSFSSIFFFFFLQQLRPLTTACALPPASHQIEPQQASSSHQHHHSLYFLMFLCYMVTIDSLCGLLVGFSAFSSSCPSCVVSKNESGGRGRRTSWIC